MRELNADNMDLRGQLRRKEDQLNAEKNELWEVIRRY